MGWLEREIVIADGLKEIVLAAEPSLKETLKGCEATRRSGARFEQRLASSISKTLPALIEEAGTCTYTPHDTHSHTHTHTHTHTHLL